MFKERYLVKLFMLKLLCLSGPQTLSPIFKGATLPATSPFRSPVSGWHECEDARCLEKTQVSLKRQYAWPWEGNEARVSKEGDAGVKHRSCTQASRRPPPPVLRPRWSVPRWPWLVARGEPRHEGSGEGGPCNPPWLTGSWLQKGKAPPFLMATTTWLHTLERVATTVVLMWRQAPRLT